MNIALPLMLTLALGMSPQADTFSDRYRASRETWEASLQKGDAQGVRRSVEALLLQEENRIRLSDYNEVHSQVMALNMAARACVLDGAWEDAITYLQRAQAAAQANLACLEPGGALHRVRQENEARLPEWRDLVARQEANLKDIEARPGLSSQQMKQRQELRDQVQEARNAISDAEKALRDIELTAGLLRREAETYARSLAEWQGFLAREKADIAQAGSTTRYVADKLEQVKLDDARPRFDRLAYGRRLLRLDAANADCRRFVNGMLGLEEAPAEPEKPAAPAPRKGRKRKG